MAICQGTTKNGEPCREQALKGTMYCQDHKPDNLIEPDDVYDRLAKATPEEKADIVRHLISEHPEGRLELPNQTGIDAVIRGVDLEGVSLKEADLRYANLQGAKLIRANLQEANLLGANLQGAQLQDANLQKSTLFGAQLQDAYLTFANLQEANLRYANLQGAKLSRTNLQKVDLRYAKLQGVKFTKCKLNHICISNAELEKTSFRFGQLDGEIGEELRARDKQLSLKLRIDYCEEAKNGYMILKQNFDELGDYDAASRAYRKERRMEKLEALLEGHQATLEIYIEIRGVLLASIPFLSVKPLFLFKDAFRNYTQYALDKFVELLCDYGESIPRTLNSLVVIYAIFTFIYWLTWGVMRENVPTRDLSDVALFSLGAMTTMTPDNLKASTKFVEFLASLEALLGIAITGLLGFVLGNRIRHS